MNKRWKVDSGETIFGKDPSEIHEKGCLSYNRNDYCKAQQRSSAAIMRTIFVRCFRVFVCHVIQFNCDVTLRPRFNAYVVVSVYKANLAFQCQKFRLAIPLIANWPNTGPKRKIW